MNPVSNDEVAIFAKAGNEHDAYLDSGDANFTHSNVYFFPDGKTVRVWHAGIHIHVTKVDKSRTKVEVFVHKPWIFVGERKRYVFPIGFAARSGASLSKLPPRRLRNIHCSPKVGDCDGRDEHAAADSSFGHFGCEEISIHGWRCDQSAGRSEAAGLGCPFDS